MAPERLIGYIGIDSGLLAVGDPSYLVHGGSIDPPEWEQFVAEVSDESNPRRIEGTTAVEVEAVIVTPTGGDGLFPVRAIIDEGSGQVLSLTVDIANPS